ncbi:hypothetical protein FRB90_005534, partial [Tulasnella sp. 427]
PEGYALWVKERRNRKHYDVYLYGFGAKKKFRTPREFAFHAVWLYDDNYFAAGDEACQCTLHTNRPQGEINVQWIYGYKQRRQRSNSHAAEERGFDPRGGGGGGGGGGRGVSNRQGSEEEEDISDDENDGLVKPVVRWDRSKMSLLTATGGPTPNPLWRPPHLVADAAVHIPEVPRDAPSEHRPLELVWVSVDPLQSWKSQEEPIRSWPALIKPPDLDQPQQTYKIELLGVNTRHEVNQIDIHTWQSQPLPQDFLQRSLPNLEGGRWRPKEGLNKFRPLPISLDLRPSPIPRQYDQAILPYAIALRQAFNIAGQYTSFEEDLFGDVSEGDGEFYYGPEQIREGDLVRLALDRRGFERRGSTRRWLSASGGAYDRPLFGLVLPIANDDVGRRTVRFSARIFELQSVATYSIQSTTRNLPDAPEGFRFREITPSMFPAQKLSIHDIAARYDQDDALVTASSFGRIEARRGSTSPPQGSSRRVGGARRRSRSIEAIRQDATAERGINASEWVESREEGIRRAQEEALRVFYGNA